MDVQSVLTVVSLILSVFSIILAIWATRQAKQYNDDTGKILQDNEYIMLQQIKFLNEMQKNLNEINRTPGKVQLGKDKIILHKLSNYKKSDTDKAMDVIEKLSIKKKFKDDIKVYLESERIDYEGNFYGEASGDILIEKIYSLLLNCNIVVSVSYSWNGT